MKILVFSDSHGDKTAMHEIISRKRAEIDLVIHLGDKSADMEEISRAFPTIAFIGVRGNCDYFGSSDTPLSRTYTYDGHTLYITHGHSEGVKSGEYALLCAKAKSVNADIALFGHTHVNTHKTIDGITVFNPGSISLPRDGTPGTYGVITIDKNNVKTEIKERGKD